MKTNSIKSTRPKINAFNLISLSLLNAISISATFALAEEPSSVSRFSSQRDIISISTLDFGYHDSAIRIGDGITRSSDSIRLTPLTIRGSTGYFFDNQDQAGETIKFQTGVTLIIRELGLAGPRDLAQGVFLPLKPGIDVSIQVDNAKKELIRQNYDVTIAGLYYFRSIGSADAEKNAVDSIFELTMLPIGFEKSIDPRVKIEKTVAKIALAEVAGHVAKTVEIEGNVKFLEADFGKVQFGPISGIVSLTPIQGMLRLGFSLGAAGQLHNTNEISVQLRTKDMFLSDEMGGNRLVDTSSVGVVEFANTTSLDNISGSHVNLGFTYTNETAWNQIDDSLKTIQSYQFNLGGSW